MTPPTKRLRHLASIRNSNVDKKSHEGEQAVRLCNYTDVYYSDLINDASGFMEASATPDEVNRFTLRRSQVLITKDSETADDIGIPAYVPHDMPGVVCGYHLTQITPGDDLDGRYLAWCLRSKKLAAWFEVSARGVTRFSLGQDAINNAPIPAPNEAQQRRIADFLDRETARIDALVDKKQRLTDLLEEKRVATITQAVTKGLDPTAPMKDSGIPWIGDVPTHWRVSRVGRLTTCLDGRRIPVSAEERASRIGRYPYYGASRVVGHIDEYLFDEPLLLLGEDGAQLLNQRVPIAQLVDEPCWVNNHAHVLSVTTGSRRFLHRYLNVFDRATFVEGATRPKLTQESMNEIPVPFPPVAEQVTIAEFLNERMSRLDCALGALIDQIVLISEYREALITAAVTGDIDVDTFGTDQHMEEVAG